ncbi:E3 ubiquitin/ISG15 ligase TRIM25-like isoform X1 [Mastacembelus armatus]|uniref:E3 ubiquitin/ISG15 ligase TRIM25-like isoform X1 n=1 Tax=Mastacembelus armatus TaxID=205130 RepID=UPI000E4637F3|nr:E3 ubiquitin/ISG15 ligase TRIM25-like isoform X1 [Mastacembelus armatus]
MTQKPHLVAMAELEENTFSLMSLEDDLTCSICLSTFNCPVTIPCGHNFCQDCLLDTWKESYSCPQCRTLFPIKPELKKNTVLSAVVETFMVKASKNEAASLYGEEKQAEKKDAIRCDTCMEAEAAQTCLTCMASFCEEHLRPHRENPNFSLHQLSEPVGDLLDRICPDHHKLMEFFCSQHSRPICSFCLQQVHKGCSFISPEEQRNLNESDLRDKLGLLHEKMEKTEVIMLQMNEAQSKLKDGATKRKAALADLYQQMRDMLAQEERKSQIDVDRELEIGQTKLRDLMTKFSDNSEKMRKATDDINTLLSQSQTLAFLQASFDLPRVVKFEPHMPRINLDSKKVTAAQAFAGALKEFLTETFKQDVEARLPIIKSELNTGVASGEKAVPVSEPASTAKTKSQSESEEKKQPRSHSPGRLPIQQQFQPVNISGFPYMEPQAGWNPLQFAHGHGYMAPFRAGPNTPKKSDTSHHFHKKQEKEKKQSSGPGGHKPGTPGSNFPQKDHHKSHPPSAKHHPRPKKNN